MAGGRDQGFVLCCIVQSGCFIVGRRVVVELHEEWIMVMFCVVCFMSG